MIISYEKSKAWFSKIKWKTKQNKNKNKVKYEEEAMMNQITFYFGNCSIFEYIIIIICLPTLYYSFEFRQTIHNHSKSCLVNPFLLFANTLYTTCVIHDFNFIFWLLILFKENKIFYMNCHKFKVSCAFQICWCKKIVFIIVLNVLFYNLFHLQFDKNNILIFIL